MTILKDCREPDVEWRPPEEKNLLLEVMEDNRLRGIGIDPDGDSVDITVELMRLEEIEARDGRDAESSEAEPPEE